MTTKRKPTTNDKFVQDSFGNIAKTIWQPTMDSVISTNERGAVVSRYGDSIWDLSHQAGRPIVLNFGDGQQRKGATLISKDKYVAIAFLEHESNIDDVVNSPIFHLNDTNLSSSLSTWGDAWRKLTAVIRRAPYDESHHGRSIRFPMPMDHVQPQNTVIYSELESEIPAFLAVHANFCKYLRQFYPEVDLITTSIVARNRYTPRPVFG